MSFVHIFTYFTVLSFSIYLSVYLPICLSISFYIASYPSHLVFCAAPLALCSRRLNLTRRFVSPGNTDADSFIEEDDLLVPVYILASAGTW